jgi:CheY-like chemotaxis protein
MSTRVLLVEDEPILVSLYTMALNSDGYEVTTALDATTAEQRLLINRPHAILLDLLIPIIPSGTLDSPDFHEPVGFRILRLVKSNPTLAHIKVLVLSNLDSDEHINTAKKLGADEYLVKASLEPHDLALKIKDALNRHAPVQMG